MTLTPRSWRDCGDFVSGSVDVGDLEAGGDLDVGSGGLVAGFAVGGIGADAGVSGGDEALGELLTVVVGDGGDGVGLGLDGHGHDGEADGLFVSVAGYGEGGGLRFGGPAGGELEANGAFGRAFDAAVDGDLEVE